MNKIILMIVVVLSMTACKVGYPLWENVVVLERDKFPMQFCRYLFLKPQGNYEIYTKCDGGESILGKWERHNDTLVLIPKYEYDYSRDTLYHVDIKSVAGMNQFFIIKKEILEDVTDYLYYVYINGVYQKFEGSKETLPYRLINYKLRGNLLKMIQE